MVLQVKMLQLRCWRGPKGHRRGIQVPLHAIVGILILQRLIKLDYTRRRTGRLVPLRLRCWVMKAAR